MWVIETERLYARPWCLDSDIEAVIGIYSHPEVVRFIGNQRIKTREQAQAYLQFRIEKTQESGGIYGSWALVERRSGAVIGCILLKVLPGKNHVPTEHIEVGWHLAREAWGQGFATEAARAMVHRALHVLGLRRVVAVAEPANLGSIAVMQRLGMKHVQRCSDFYDGELLDHYELCS